MCCRVYRNVFWDLKDELEVKTPIIDVEHKYRHVVFSSQFYIKFVSPCSVPTILLRHREILGSTLSWCMNGGKKVTYHSVQHFTSKRCKVLTRGIRLDTDSLSLTWKEMAYLEWTGMGKNRDGIPCFVLLPRAALCLGKSFPGWPKPAAYHQAEMAEDPLNPHHFSSLSFLSIFRNSTGNWKGRPTQFLRSVRSTTLPIS